MKLAEEVNKKPYRKQTKKSPQETPKELAKKPTELLFIYCNSLKVFNIPDTCRIICTLIY